MLDASTWIEAILTSDQKNVEEALNIQRGRVFWAYGFLNNCKLESKYQVPMESLKITS